MIDRFGLWSRTLREDLPKLIDYLQSLCPAGRILDVGCGPGVLLASLPPEKYQRVGIEHNHDEIQFAAEHFHLTVLSDLPEIRSIDDTFDLVTAVEVIEHVTDPAEFLNDLIARTRPGGHIVITTPNIDCWDYYRFKNRCPHFVAPMHVNFFTPKNLIQLAKRLGLTHIDTWFRGSDFSFTYWRSTNNKTIDLWIPDVPFQDAAVVYVDRDGNIHYPDYMYLDRQYLDPKPQQNPRSMGGFARWLNRKSRYAMKLLLRPIAKQNQMVLAFKR